MSDILKDKDEEEGEGAGDGEELDPRLEAGWRALDAGEIDVARTAAQAVIAGGLPENDPDEAAAGARFEGLLLHAACAREAGDGAAAIESLARAAKGDPEWCTPELWMAELLSEDPDRLDEALRHARRALDRAEGEEEYLEALACKAAIELDLGRPTQARKTLSGLPAADVPLDDPLVALELAELLMHAGDAGEAGARLRTLVAKDPDLADAWYVLGACAEAMDDEESKRAAWVRTRELDLRAIDAPGPDAVVGSAGVLSASPPPGPPGPRLTEEALVAVAEETFAALPDELRGHLRNVPIVVAELPAAADVAAGLDPRLLGVFSGTPHAESGGVLDPPVLTEIVLFRSNIERVAGDDEALRDEVRTTLLHEAGHFFGLDEAALGRLGLE
jgi:predicted Zn-dependent protease with MMP-like domain